MRCKDFLYEFLWRSGCVLMFRTKVFLFQYPCLFSKSENHFDNISALESLVFTTIYVLFTYLPLDFKSGWFNNCFGEHKNEIMITFNDFINELVIY